MFKKYCEMKFFDVILEKLMFYVKILNKFGGIGKYNIKILCL